MCSHILLSWACGRQRHLHSSNRMNNDKEEEYFKLPPERTSTENAVYESTNTAYNGGLKYSFWCRNLMFDLLLCGLAPRALQGTHPAAAAARMRRMSVPGTGKVTSARCAWMCTSALTCVTPATTSSVNPVWGRWLRTAPPTPPVPSAEQSSHMSSSRRVS